MVYAIAQQYIGSVLQNLVAIGITVKYETPQLPTLVMVGDPVENIQSAFVEPVYRLVVSY